MSCVITEREANKVTVDKDAKFIIPGSVKLIQNGKVVAIVPATFDLTGVDAKFHEFVVQLAYSRRVQCAIPTDEQRAQRSAKQPEPVNCPSILDMLRKWRKGIMA